MINKFLSFDLEQNFFPSMIKLLDAEALDLECTFSLEDQSFDHSSGTQRVLVPVTDRIIIYAGSRDISEELEAHLPTLWEAIKKDVDAYADTLDEGNFE